MAEHCVSDANHALSGRAGLSLSQTTTPPKNSTIAPKPCHPERRFAAYPAGPSFRLLERVGYRFALAHDRSPPSSHRGQPNPKRSGKPDTPPFAKKRQRMGHPTHPNQPHSQGFLQPEGHGFSQATNPASQTPTSLPQAVAQAQPKRSESTSSESSHNPFLINALKIISSKHSANSLVKPLNHPTRSFQKK
jgi:hypothetical protein